MDLELLESASWRAAGDPAPSAVARAVSALREWYVSRERVAPATAAEGRARQARVERATEALAKLAFYGVVDAAKVSFVMNELAAASALPRAERWRVLDVGAGAGSTTLALAEWMRANARGVKLDAVGVDVDGEALRAAPRLLSAWQAAATAAERVDWQGIVGDVTRAQLPAGPFELILCSNVLNEIARAASDPAQALFALTTRLGAALSPSGALLILEPALRESSRALHHLRDAVIARGAQTRSEEPDPSALTVFAPCTRAQAPCPMLANARDWCHEERLVPLPERVRLVARLAGINRHTLKYAYLVLRRGGPRLADVRPALDHRVVSGQLVSKGRDEVFLCGPVGQLRVLRNRRDVTPSNAAFDALDRGQLVRVEPLEPARPRVGRETEVEAWDPGKGTQEQQ